MKHDRSGSGDAAGDTFFRQTRYERGNLPRHALDFSRKPAEFKIHQAPVTTIPLPEPAPFKVTGLEDVLRSRQSRRSFSGEPLSLAELSAMLAYTTGISSRSNQDGPFLRHVPSAGNLHPHETHVVVNQVDGLDQGVYHFNVPGNKLDMIKKGDHRGAIAGACLDQDMAATCGAVLAWTAVVPRSKWKYMQRCYRYIYMDLGHVGQNFYLVAEALGLAACTIGAIYDNELDALLGVDGVDETGSYVGVVGHRRS